MACDNFSTGSRAHVRCAAPGDWGQRAWEAWEAEVSRPRVWPDGAGLRAPRACRCRALASLAPSGRLAVPDGGRYQAL